jgi:hypothetical protein
MDLIQLSNREPFGVGGRRLCFAHPSDASKCIKVLRTDARRTVRVNRSSAYFARFRREYNNNSHEQAILERLGRQIGPAMSQHFPRCYGMFPTDLGPGLVLDLVRYADGRISRSIRELISTGTPLEALQPAYERFAEFLIRHRVQTRALLDHNLVAQKNRAGAWTLFLIDGFGDPSWLPVGSWIPTLALRRIERRIRTAWPRMEAFARSGGVSLEVIRESSWGQGFLAHRDEPAREC